MDRKLASIQTIIDIKPISGADKIEVATVLGWKVCVQKDQFKVGDKCIYIEIDSVLPEQPEFEFLRSKNFRIKTIRLRGQISQGICFSIETCFPCAETLPLQEGMDVTEILGVTKYEPPLSPQLSGEAKGFFPSFITKTDATRIQAVPKVLKRHNGKAFYASEKLDGSSMSCFLNEGVFGVCSRNLELKDTEGNTFWKVAKRDALEEKLRLFTSSNYFGPNLAIQGELIGPGIQKNKYNLKDWEFRAFRIYDISRGTYLSYVNFIISCNTLNIKTVPIIEQDFILTDVTVDGLVQMSIGTSVLNPSVQREGLVFRSMVEGRDEELGQLTFKVINLEFLLKYE